MESSNSEPKEGSENTISEDGSDKTYSSSDNDSDESSDASPNNQNSENADNSGSKPENPPEEEDTNRTPILEFLKENSTKEMSFDDDITQKLIIIYGMAARLHIIHENNSTNVNVTPDYIYLDENLFPYIDLEKLKSDSKKQSADTFLLLKREYSLYFPPEANDDKISISNDIDLKKRVDIYIFGCLCYSLLSNKMVDGKTKMYESLQDLSFGHFISEDLSSLICSCLDENHIFRPFASDIVYIINSEEFLAKVGTPDTFDFEKFKKFQLTVTDQKIQMIINPDYDISKLPNVRLYEKADFDVKFNKNNNLYKGTASDVYRGYTKSEPKIAVAYKILKKNAPCANEKRLFREVEILSSVNHHAVQNLYGYIKPTPKNKNQEVIITVLQENGSLDKVIDKANDDPNLLDFTQRYIIMYGIAAGMHYLHKLDIVHRDLKPNNVFMNEHFEPIISDFGLSKRLLKKEDLGNSNANEGTEAYMAPEQFISNDCFFNLYNAKQADVYSFAISIHYLFTGIEPWSKVSMVGNRVQNGDRPSIPEDFPKTIGLLIEACWNNSPEMRPSFEVILQMLGHPTFIENLGYEIDMNRFKEYQKKVVDDSFILDENSSDNDKNDYKTISFNDVFFPPIPKDKVFSEEDFEDANVDDNKMSPFFTRKIIKKDSQLFNRFEIKDEYLSDHFILSCLKTEMQVLLKINHPTFNPLYGVIDHPSKVTYNEDARDIYDVFPQGDIKPPVLITPYLSNGSLLISQSKLNITQKFIILYGVAAGMYHLHKQEMTHLNLKPSNILINDDYEPFINIDIVSKQRNEKENLLYFLPVFSFPYVAPEIINFKVSHSQILKEKRADVYSFAMVAYFLFSGIHPYETNQGFHPILMKIMRGERPITDKIIQHPFDKLIEDCWSIDPNDRPSFKTILERIGSEDFIRSINNLDLEQFQEYQKKVVSEEFIKQIQFCSIRKREEFEVIENLGSGLLGNVTKCNDKKYNNKVKVVLKEIPGEHADLIEQQKRHLSMLNFPSIISLYGFIEPTKDKKDFAIITPYVECLNLDSVLKGNKKSGKNFNYTRKCIVMYGVAMGMYKLHFHNIAHQDLKPSNVLIDINVEPLITDFNLLKFVSSNQSILQTLTIGPNYYMAPEAFFSKVDTQDDYDEKKADVYSFGMLVYYLMTSIEPFEKTGNLRELMTSIKEGKRPEIPESISKKMRELITSCWDPDPSLRPSFYDIVDQISDPDFYKMKKNKFERQKFYDYQVKLGEPKFIKFDEESLSLFQHSGSSSMSDLRISSSIHYLPEVLITEMANKEDNAEMQYRSGCMYRHGKGTKKDEEKAMEYFKKAADNDHIHGIIACAKCYKKGIGCQADEDKALNLIQKAIDKGSVDALIILARWYMTSFPRRYKDALEILIKADEKDHPDAQALIASLVENNKVSLDINVIDYYKKSCNLGSYEGMFQMATNYHYGIGINKDLDEAIRLYILVSKSKNYNKNKSLAVYQLAKLYEEKGEFQSAFNLAESHRNKERFVGYFLCSEFLRNGVGCDKNIELAKQYEKVASDKKFVHDQLKFAMIFHHGKGIKDEEKFLKWLEIAAKNDSPIAQANLCHYHVKRDTKEQAKQWGEKSANNGYRPAIWNLAHLYRKSKDYQNEASNLQKLADFGYRRALVHLGKNLKRKKKFSEAFQKFKEAADRKSVSGIYHCGVELFNGKLTDKNVDEGLKLMKNAADVGYRKALKKLINIYKNGLEGVEKNLEIAQQYEERLKRTVKCSDDSELSEKQ